VSKSERVALDVAALPSVVFGERNLLWWGTLGFAVIESVTMLLTAAALLYLRKNFHAWPPESYAPPDWVVPTIGVVIMLATCIPAHFVKKAAVRLDARRTADWLVVMVGCALVLCVLRWLDYRALHVRWTTNAYGSAIWVLVSLHASLILIEVAEMAGIAGIFVKGPVLPKHFPDATDITNYWYFLIGSWLPIYALVYLGPFVL
jgi:heme/copper-type cytochrome/quinol oxidase subunit 3